MNTDEHFLKMAIRIAQQNPDRHRGKSVGAVIVVEPEKPATSFFIGYRQTLHNVGGYEDCTTHAEDMALQSAGWMAKGATLYVTMEPCLERLAHPAWAPKQPCVDLIIAAGIKRVVCGAKDDWVGARGAEKLQAAGIVVEFADEHFQLECQKLLANSVVPAAQQAHMTQALKDKENA